MRRNLVVTAVSLLVFAALLSAGCGKDTSKVRVLMKNADTRWEQATVRVGELTEATAMLVSTALSGKVESIQPEKFTDLEKRLKEVWAELQDIKAEFGKLTEQKDFKEYVRYAEMMRAALAEYIRFVEAGQKFFGSLKPYFESRDAVGMAAAIRQKEAEIAEIQERRKKAEELYRKAVDYKFERKLE